MADVQWYYTCGDEKRGPVSYAELREAARSGDLDPRGDLVWSRGMLDWKAAGEVEGLFSKRGAPALKPKEEEAPGSRPKIRNVRNWKGSPSSTGRLTFLFCAVIAPALIAVAIYLLTPMAQPYLGNGLSKDLPTALYAIAPLLMLVATVSRLRNLGMSGWWVFGMLVPGLDFWLGFRCLACPADYAASKKLDAPGWIVGALYWCAILVGVALPSVAYFKGEPMPDPRLWLERVKAIHISIPSKMKDDAKPAAGAV